MLKKPWIWPACRSTVRRRSARLIANFLETARGDRDARLVFLVATRIGIVRDDRRDAPGGRAAGRVDHDEQLHDASVHRWRHRLHDKDVAGSDVLLEADEDVFVRELEDVYLTEGHLQIAANRAGEIGVSIPRKNLQVLVEWYVCHDKARATIC